MIDNDHLRIDESFSYRGISAVLLENNHLRVLVLPGKGGDILEFRDKRTDVDVLWQADHDWQRPGDGALPITTADAYHDYYPGGWQLHVPVAGTTDDFDGTPYGLHGESALIPWDATIDRSGESVSLHLEAELVRYPFRLERTLTLGTDACSLEIEETIENVGAVDLPYIWQQHVALGPPLIGPDATLRMPASTGLVDDYGPDHANNRLEAGSRFEWPSAPGVDGDAVDLRKFPSGDATIHDVVYATGLTDGHYAVSNEALNLSFEFFFPSELFETVWNWRSFGGQLSYPYWGRNYTAGLEPTTAFPAGDVPEAQRETGTLKHLKAGECVTATFRAAVGRTSD